MICHAAAAAAQRLIQWISLSTVVDALSPTANMSWKLLDMLHWAVGQVATCPLPAAAAAAAKLGDAIEYKCAAVEAA